MIPNGADPNRDQMPKWVKDILTHGLAAAGGAVLALIFVDKDRGDVIVETGKGSVRKGD